MAPDQFISTIHRQWADQTALRMALTDLAQVLLPEQREQWLQALQARIANVQLSAQTLPADHRAGGLELVAALDFLHKSLAQLPEPSELPETQEIIEATVPK